MSRPGASCTKLFLPHLSETLSLSDQLIWVLSIRLNWEDRINKVTIFLSWYQYWKKTGKHKTAKLRHVYCVIALRVNIQGIWQKSWGCVLRLCDAITHKSQNRKRRPFLSLKFYEFDPKISHEIWHSKCEVYSNILNVLNIFNVLSLLQNFPVLKNVIKCNILLFFVLSFTFFPFLLEMEKGKKLVLT